jgi:hypothetical protein
LLTASHGVFAPGVELQGLIQGAATLSNSVMMRRRRFRVEVAFHECPLSGAQGADVETSPPGSQEFSTHVLAREANGDARSLLRPPLGDATSVEHDYRYPRDRLCEISGSAEMPTTCHSAGLGRVVWAIITRASNTFSKSRPVFYQGPFSPIQPLFQPPYAGRAMGILQTMVRWKTQLRDMADRHRFLMNLRSAADQRRRRSGFGSTERP